jgi:DNA-binding transcriptional ArsR family regulator
MIAKKNIFDFEARRKIYKFIEENPGLNINELSRRAEIPMSTLMYHLRKLEKQELVELKSKGKYKHIYLKNVIGVQDKEILELLRKKIPCRILLHFFFSSFCSQAELSRELDLHPATISYYLKKLVKMGIIEEAPVGNGMVYPYPNPKPPIGVSGTPRCSEIFYRRKNREIFGAIARMMTAHKDSLADAQYINEYYSYLRDANDLGLDFKNIRKNAEEKVIVKDGKKVTYIKFPSLEDFCDLYLEFFRPPFCA